MKKITTLLKDFCLVPKCFVSMCFLSMCLLSMCFATSSFAQNEDVRLKMTGPNYVDEFHDEFVTVSGISSDGRYIFGALPGGQGPGAYINLYDGSSIKWLQPEIEYSMGVRISGITYDGVVFVSENNKTYTLDLNSGAKTYLESPSAEYGLDIWDITADGSMIVGNMTDADCYYNEPLYGIKQSDGTYKTFLLDFDKNDAMGCEAQFTHVRCVTEDGNHIVGIQLDYRGLAPRMVAWDKQPDGTFAFSTPLDEVIYDLSIEKPGMMPDWYDYVSADEQNEPELWEEQAAAFFKDFDAYEQKYIEFTRGSRFDAFWIRRAKRENAVYAAWCTENGTLPLMYNFDTKKTTINNVVFGRALEQLPGGGYITFDDGQILYDLTVVESDGTSCKFTEWLNKKTGVDLANEFTFETDDPYTGETLTGVFPGYPYFSHDGKTLVLAGSDQDYYPYAAVLTFDADIFTALGSGIDKVQVTNKVIVVGNKLSIGDGKTAIAEVYAVDGAKVGIFAIDGCIDFSGTLEKGIYILKVKVENDRPISVKLMVR